MLFDACKPHIETTDSTKPPRSLLSALIGLVMRFKPSFCHHLYTDTYYELDLIRLPPTGDKQYYEKCKTGRVILRHVCMDCGAVKISHVNRYGVITDMSSKYHAA
ncbi:MAG: hypothetical protein A2511_16415 [Deltaproteobacteria bacterium RIFOXYD12_FULL_50_9]|nr:MAG: hypothetical protein A2511_16415 [Deltaproteobacteria bacterium RIFOXYD12_FULL_50_9]